MSAWTVDDVAEWLKSLDGSYIVYIEKFKKDHVDGYRLYRSMNDKILLEYGVNNEIHRRNILQSIEQLKIKFLNGPRN